MKEIWIDWVYTNQGLGTARSVYESLLQEPGISLQFVQRCLDLEQAQLNKDNTRIRRLYEKSIELFGRYDTNLWLDFIQFETDIAEIDFGRVNALYWKATKELENPSEFVAKYQERKNTLNQ